MRARLLLLLLAFNFSAFVFSQFSVSGNILDTYSKEPLEGVSIFYDGTTIGTTSDKNGFFELKTKYLITSYLIVSYIGYETQVFDASEKKSFGTIYLKEKAVQLDEVTLVPDTWSREKKMKIFKKEFLGHTKSASKCIIINEEDIRLYYNSRNNKLHAYTERPIQVLNNFLGYLVEYNLVDFEVDFINDNQEFPKVHSTYMAGTVFFSIVNSSKDLKKYTKRKEKVYLGSSLHFMRALSRSRLNEEKFDIFKRSFKINPDKEYIVNRESDGRVKVQQKSKKLSILFKNKQSFIRVSINSFYIDSYGNHSSTRDIYFGGEMGKLRIGSLLPLDYKL